MRCEQSRRVRFSREVGIKTEDNIGLGGFTFKLQPGEEAASIIHCHIVQRAIALRFKGLLDGLTGAVFPGEG